MHFQSSTPLTYLKKENVQVIFAREWLGHGPNISNWLDSMKAEEYCESKFNESNYLEQDVGTEGVWLMWKLLWKEPPLEVT
jgi:hypothetical protein